MSEITYQIGGSLNTDAPTYVKRKADDHIYQALKNGEFCYVLNSRQMGKSSLLVRTLHRLQAEGFQCSTIDMTRIGSENITPLQWYKGMIAELWRGFNLLGSVNLKTWWRDSEDVSFLQRLSHFIEDIILVQFPQERIFIFIDEIDSILSLDFAVDDFFALIRFCYNQRAINPEYNRLSFAIFGVATPSDLIADKKRTPFNIGQAIDLQGFELAEAQLLVKGLESAVSNPPAVLKQILAWSSGQPFLTQKICYLAYRASRETADGFVNIPPGTEAFWVDSLVRSRIIDKWESQDEPEHLKTIRDRLLRDEQRAGRLLGIYQQILQSEPPLTPPDQGGGQSESPLLRGAGELGADDSREPIELVLSGLVEKKAGLLKVKNRIYAEVFNLEWVEKQLGKLRPYSQTFETWIASKQTDYSRLLRGQALKDAQAWAQGKSLSDLDYQFLAASVQVDRAEVQLVLEAERAKEIAARLAIQRQSARRQKRLLVAVSLALIVSVMLGVMTLLAYRKSAISEVRAIAIAANGTFASHQHLDALVQAVQARQKFLRLWLLDSNTRLTLDSQTRRVLEQAAYGADEVNRLSAHQGGILSVDFSPDGKWIATGGTDRTMRIWQRDGTLVRTLTHDATLHNVKFSPDSQRIAAAGLDGAVRLWWIDGKPLATIKAHKVAVWSVEFSPDGQIVASASADRTIKLWRTDGTLIRTLAGHQAATWQLAFSPDGEMMASCSVDNTIKLWRTDGILIRTIPAGKAAVWSVEFSPDGQMFVSGGADRLLKLWSREGELLKTLEGHTGEIYRVAFSRDGQTIVSASNDKTVKLWRRDGTLLRTFEGHQSPIRSVALSPDGQTIASASEDATVKLWKSSPFLHPLYGNQDVVWQTIYLPGKHQESLLATVAGKEIKLWRLDGSLAKTVAIDSTQFLTAAFNPNDRTLAAAGTSGNIYLIDLTSDRTAILQGHNAAIWAVRQSKDGQFLISGGDDFTLKLWQRSNSGEFQLRQTIPAHSARIWNLAFSPDDRFVASASADGTVKLWKWRDANHLREQPDKIIKGHKSAIWGVDISPDSQYIISAGRDGQLLLWNRNGELVRAFEGGSIGLSRVAFSPDGRRIAAASLNNSIKIWTLNGSLLATLSGHTAGVLSVAFSTDGKTLLSGSYDQTAIVWNLEQIFNLDLLEYACSLLQDYLQTNAELAHSDAYGTEESAGRSLCTGVETRKAAQ